METILLPENTSAYNRPKNFKRHLKKEAPFGVGSGALVWQFLFFYAPLVLMLISSFSRFHIDGTFESFTFAHFKQILKIDYFLVIFESLTSFRVSFSLYNRSQRGKV
jgi:ABC-type spermidine/putrescine transport system permease subunit II